MWTGALIAGRGRRRVRRGVYLDAGVLEVAPIAVLPAAASNAGAIVLPCSAESTSRRRWGSRSRVRWCIAAVLAFACLSEPSVSLLRIGLGTAHSAQDGSSSAHSAMSW